MTAAQTRKLTTILAIDVVGYSAAAERDQAEAVRRIATLRSRILGLANEHGGRLFSTAGDGFMVEFPLASAGVRAAITLLEECAAPASALPRVRAGAHLGEVMIDGDDLLGHGVNVAARLVARAEPNALVISDAVKTQLRGEIEGSFSSLGSIHLPKLRESVLAYAYAPDAAKPDWRGRAMAMVKRRRRALTIGAGALAAAAVAAGVMTNRPVSYVLEPMQLVAHTRRPELYPTLSPDGRSIVYIVERGETLFTDTDLYVRSVAGGEETQLTDTPDFNEATPAFSPTGDRLAYARWAIPYDSAPCEIMVRVFPSGLDRRVAVCEGGGPNRISWTPDGRGLVYSSTSYNSGEETSRISLLSLETGEVVDLVPPPSRGMGDLGATVSPDGTRVAFVRYQSPEIADVHVFDLRSRRLTRVTDGEQWAQVAWADSQNLFVFTTAPRATELWLQRSDGRRSRQRLLPALTHLTRPEVAAGMMALQVERRAANLWRSESARTSAITNGNQNDHSADFSSAGVLAFLSSQSSDWIYLQPPGEEPRQLVEVADQEAQGLRWSPDGRHLVYVASERGRSRLVIVDVVSGLAQPVRINTDENLGNPAWSSDGRSLIFASTGREGPRLMRLRIEGDAPPQPISGAGWYEAIETPEGVFAVSRTEPGIWRLGPGQAPQLALPAFRTQRDNAVLLSDREWTVSNGRFYFMDRSTPGRTRILSRTVSGGAVTTAADIEGVLVGSLAVDPLTGGLVYGVEIEDQYDIAVIPFRRR